MSKTMKIVNLDSFRDVSKKIEKMAEEGNVGYIEAAVDYCERNGLEVEFVGELINQNPALKTKIEYEAETLNFIKRIDRLPLDD